MAEFWDLYDINRNKLGRLHERGLSLNAGEYHLVVEIWVINSSNQILLTKRHPDKRWGSYWECTAGAVVTGEDSLSGAKRELLEEIGIKVIDEQMIFLGSITNKDWFTDTYFTKLDVPICNLKLQESEVVDAKWVDIHKFQDMCSKQMIIHFAVNSFNLYKEKLKL